MARLEAKRFNQEQCLTHMRTKYGSQMDIVSATIYLTSYEVETYFGQKCDQYDPYCPVCKAWLQWNTTGTVTIELDRSDIMRLLTRMD